MQEQDRPQPWYVGLSVCFPVGLTVISLFIGLISNYAGSGTGAAQTPAGRLLELLGVLMVLALGFLFLSLAIVVPIMIFRASRDRSGRTPQFRRDTTRQVPGWSRYLVPGLLALVAALLIGGVVTALDQLDRGTFEYRWAQGPDEIATLINEEGWQIVPQQPSPNYLQRRRPTPTSAPTATPTATVTVIPASPSPTRAATAPAPPSPATPSPTPTPTAP